ncbi:hypothetical protein ACFVP0_27020 [Streptomyces cinereoruber]|uniref:hypothetical protein n=1 Tax=Streptomyces cinereoruber TaxID=67260 RepID=UPI0036D1613F
MFEHTGWTSGAGRVADRQARLPDHAARLPDRVAHPSDRTAHPPDRAARLPDLAAVDLRTLRVLEDPALVAEVDRVLGRASELGESWFSDEGAE